MARENLFKTWHEHREFTNHEFIILHERTTPTRAPKRLRDKRAYKDVCNACLSFVNFAAPDGGQYIPFTRDGEEIEIGVFGNTEDKTSGLYLHRSVARLEKTIQIPKNDQCYHCRGT
jgi:hypothetical protein